MAKYSELSEERKEQIRKNQALADKIRKYFEDDLMAA